MKKHLLIELILVVVILTLGFWSTVQQQKTISLKENLSTLKEGKKEYTKMNQQLISEKEHLSDQVVAVSNSLKELQQKNPIPEKDVDIDLEFTDIVTKLFKANLNFTPQNYDDKMNEVSNYLSDELNREYFGQERDTYQDMNGTTSMLESLEVYPKVHQDNELEGLIITHYKSNQSGKDWVKGVNIFKVAYHSKKRKIIKIINMGSRYSDY